MKFLTKDFLLSNDTARELFHNAAKRLPIIDYHNHLDHTAIAADRAYSSLAELWVKGDPYKHRAMRINGIPENKISGKASDAEKFAAWAETSPKLWGNPLFHWSAMELSALFGIDEILTKHNAAEIARQADAVLQSGRLTTNSILKSWNVETLCTSDDLLDDVSIHKAASAKAETFSVRPSLRADSIFAFQTSAFAKWILRLKEIYPVKNLDDYLHVISLRLNAFDGAGCKLADHSLDNGFRYDLPDKASAYVIFDTALKGSASECDIVRLKSYILHELAKEYAKRKWALQLHIGAERFTSSRLRTLAGPAGGYATIGSAVDIKSVARLLDDAEKEGCLPKVIVYTLNPADNQALATLTGSFGEDGVAGKIQFGPAWWYNDHKEGINAHFRSLASYGLLSRFIGMTTDSRSILSFSRHEYFRRLLCNFVGELAEAGEIPSDFEYLAQAVKDVSYNNAKNWIF